MRLTESPSPGTAKYSNTDLLPPPCTQMHQVAARCSETLREARSATESGHPPAAQSPLGYDEPVAREIVRQWSKEEFFADVLPPTNDDVPIALDGRVLDSPEKVIAYLDEINRRRATASTDA